MITPETLTTLKPQQVARRLAHEIAYSVLAGYVQTGNVSTYLGYNHPEVDGAMISAVEKVLQGLAWDHDTHSEGH